MDTVPYEAVDGNAAVVEEQFNNVQTTDPVDFVGESVNNDYAQLLDAMTILDATDAVGANTSGPENVNLLSRVSQMLDNKDQQ